VTVKTANCASGERGAEGRLCHQNSNRTQKSSVFWPWGPQIKSQTPFPGMRATHPLLALYFPILLPTSTDSPHPTLKCRFTQGPTHPAHRGSGKLALLRPTSATDQKTAQASHSLFLSTAESTFQARRLPIHTNWKKPYWVPGFQQKKKKMPAGANQNFLKKVAGGPAGSFSDF
jgi:hypothetical protein